MSRTRLLYPLSAALATALVLSACKKPEPTPAPAPTATTPAPITPAPAAAPTASVTALDLGNSVGADNRVAAPATTFAPKDTIYASVTTRTSDAAATVPGRLGAKWTFQDGQTVHEDSRDLSLTGDGTTAFQISKPDGFPPGRYKVEISLDGTVVQSKEFEVK
ncbi:hypothetical protein [Pseudoxanthomonas daejeonensis]|uniref:PKD domain-containing protein n=1 Tax=Pseudoxanthomonas daejeonensis TaxID=266062 RepID=A0ABQ6ZBV5_9GAMM|nr:hypothetical protein [Pseudoxanthomonas daejeonensis]KAF1697523.1 hypothetical protein CSC65_01265 [Pseudoxanthomonas daejeonensis]